MLQIVGDKYLQMTEKLIFIAQTQHINKSEQRGNFAMKIQEQENDSSFFQELENEYSVFFVPTFLDSLDWSVCINLSWYCNPLV